MNWNGGWAWVWLMIPMILAMWALIALGLAPEQLAHPPGGSTLRHRVGRTLERPIYSDAGPYSFFHGCERAAINLSRPSHNSILASRPARSPSRNTAPGATNSSHHAPV